MNNCTINYVNLIITTLCWATCILSALRCPDPGTKLSWEPHHPAPSHFSEIITTMCTLASAIMNAQVAPCPIPSESHSNNEGTLWRACLQDARHRANHFTYVHSFNPPNHPGRSSLLGSLFHRRGNRVSEKFNNLPSATQLYSEKSGSSAGRETEAQKA